MVEPEAVVVVTNIRLCLVSLLLVIAMNAQAAVLPQDRSDAMYHSYQGDGVTIDGPSILLRKKIGNKVSVSANYYVDTVSGASIDVRANASPYREERTETSVSTDFLHNKTLMTVSYTNSSENDFEANSVYLGLTQDFFGDLSTLSMSYSKGWDEVGKTGDESFSEEADRQKFSVGLTQVATKHLILGINFENISDQGFLNNPYRSVRILDDSSERGFRFAPEVYPNTRTSNAVSLNANYYLPYRASIYADVRRYEDTWGIEAMNYKLGYIHTFGEDWILDVFIRHYSQEKADFYQDMFGRADEFNFMARDKELSTYSNLAAGISLSYEWRFSQTATIKKSSFHIEYDRIQFDYDNFRDATAALPEGGAPGQEPLFSFGANVLRIYASIYY